VLEKLQCGDRISKAACGNCTRVANCARHSELIAMEMCGVRPSLGFGSVQTSSTSSFYPLADYICITWVFITAHVFASGCWEGFVALEVVMRVTEIFRSPLGICGGLHHPASAVPGVPPSGSVKHLHVVSFIIKVRVF